MSEHSVIGKRLPRVDGPAKVTGEAQYTFDIVLPRMLYGATLRSPHAHARILSIDTSKAERLSGVKAVVTGKDIVGENDIQPGVEYPLAINNVHYVGEGVAAVAATDNSTAMEALNLIDVEYEELPAVLDLKEAMREDAPKANTDFDDNIMGTKVYHWGDVEKGFSECDHFREDEFRTQIVHPCYLEIPISVADFGSNGKLTFWSSTQVPEQIRSGLARSLGMGLGDVRVILPYVGGAHCGKIALHPYMVVTAILSRKSGRPVKLGLPRDEILTENRGTAPLIINMKTGVKKDGTLTAMHCKVISAAGPYGPAGAARRSERAGQGTGFMFATYLPFPYRLPNIKYEGYSVNTNHVYGGQRGTGRTPARFAYECQMDMLAEDLGIDPVEMRERNALQAGDITANGGRLYSCGLTKCLQTVTERTNWNERKGKLDNNRGLGVSCYNYHIGSTPARLAAGAFVHVHADGTATLITGQPELGQGAATVMSQIVAEELGLLLEDVRISQIDTEISPADPGATGSMGTYTTGNAVKAAADDARQQILQLAAEKLDIKAEDLEMKQRAAYVRDNPEKSIPISTLVRDALTRDGKPIMGKGQHTPEWEAINRDTGEMEDIPPYGSGSFIVEVEVDRETGNVRVVKATVAHDCGFALNPTLVEGQIHGQFHAGIGQAIYEEHIMDKGRVLNPTFLDYRIARSLDMPELETILVEIADGRGPYGAKECSEGPIGGVAPAIANAVYDAIGVRINDLPITPEKVIKALKEKGIR